MTHFVTYVSWKDLVGKPCTFDILRERLRKLPRLQTVNAAALTNVVLKTWRGNIDPDAHRKLLQMTFSPQYALRLDGLARNKEHPRFVFHRQQLLFLIKEALVHCIDAPDMDARFNAEFAKCCLMANDLMQYGLRVDPALPQVEHIIPETVTVNDYSYRENIGRKTARTRLLLDEVLSAATIRARKEYVDIPALFFQLTGLSVRDYSNFLYGVLTKYQDLGINGYLVDPNQFVLSKKYFDTGHIDLKRVEAFFGEIAKDIPCLKDASSKSKRPNDFTPLRESPLLRIDDDRFIPLDLGFVADKLETGVFWRVHFGAMSTDPERDLLHAFWGHLFHEYVSQLLEDACRNSPNRFSRNPSFERSGEACDGLVACDHTVILIETKGSILRAIAKYSGSPELLTDEIERKFVGTEQNPKGVRQLARTILKCGSKKRAEAIVGVPRARRIFPVLVVRESALGSPLVNRFLNEKLQALYDRKAVRPVVTPLFVLTADELEEISGHLIDTPLDEILEAKYRRDPSQSLPFSAVHNDLLAANPDRANAFLEAKYQRILTESLTDFFGEGASAKALERLRPK